MEKTESTTELLISVESPSEVADIKLKKKFEVPEVSTPVDVLEATTYFQVADSGVTN